MLLKAIGVLHKALKGVVSKPNAFISLEYTSFHIDVSTVYFEEELASFAQLFTFPLLSQEATMKFFHNVENHNDRDSDRQEQKDKRLSWVHEIGCAPNEVEEENIIVLIDGGATHNFVDEEFVAKKKFKTVSFAGFRVFNANGGITFCEKIVQQLKISFEDYAAMDDFYVYPMGEGLT